MKPVFKIILLISLIIFSYESCTSDSPCDAEKKEICNIPEGDREGTCIWVDGYELNSETSNCERIVNYGDSCDNKYDLCGTHQECKDLKCACANGFTYKDNECKNGGNVTHNDDDSDDSYDDSDDSYDDSDGSYDDSNSKSNFIKYTIFTFACLFL